MIGIQRREVAVSNLDQGSSQGNSDPGRDTSRVEDPSRQGSSDPPVPVGEGMDRFELRMGDGRLRDRGNCIAQCEGQQIVN